MSNFREPHTHTNTVTLQCFGKALPCDLHHTGTLDPFLPLLCQNQDLVLTKPFLWVTNAIILKGRICPSVLHTSINNPVDIGLRGTDTRHVTQEGYHGAIGRWDDDVNRGQGKVAVWLCKQVSLVQ